MNSSFFTQKIAWKFLFFEGQIFIFFDVSIVGLYPTIFQHQDDSASLSNG
jgi:hypothetical protein